MIQVNATKEIWQRDEFFDPDGPVCLIIQATMGIAAGLDRFQPAGFPEVGHVIYQSPDPERDKVCIVDSPASMANHLEQVCIRGANDPTLHESLTGLPYVKCVTDRNPKIADGKITLKEDDRRDRLVATTLTEGHRIASDYFLDGRQLTETGVSDSDFRNDLRTEFNLIEVKKDKTYFIPSETWWDIYATLLKYDPNSLVHGVLFAKEQIKISRMLTAHLEAFGASRVGRSGVKFDRLGKTTSGQPIFAVDEETAQEIQATFIIDLGIMRSYGSESTKSDKSKLSLGLNRPQKEFLLALALWKVCQLLRRTFSYRSGCKLAMESVKISTDMKIDESDPLPTELPKIDIAKAIRSAELSSAPTMVYYPYDLLFKPGKEQAEGKVELEGETDSETEESED